MTQHRIPRRPAMLEPARAEAIVGDSDPAERSELAHMSAWAVLGVTEPSFPEDALARLRRLIADEGIDVIADLWSRSPEFTLPGALWRAFLFMLWLRRDSDEIRRRFSAVRASYANQSVENSIEIGPASDLANLDPQHLTPDAVEHTLRQLFQGEYSDDTMGQVFAQAAVLMRILASAEGMASWITDPSDPLAYPVSTRAYALLKTAGELEVAATYAQVGKLD